MSNELVTMAYRSRTGSGVSKSVLAALADQANSEGLCYPSISYIVERCEWDERTVRRCIEQLEQQGHITVIRRVGRGSLYRVHPRTDAQETTPGRESGVREAGQRDAARAENSAGASPRSNSAGSLLEHRDASAARHDGGKQGSDSPPTPGRESGVHLSTTCGSFIHTPGTQSGGPGTQSGVPRAESPDTPGRESTESSLNLLREPSPNLGAPDGKKNPQTRSRKVSGDSRPSLGIAAMPVEKPATPAQIEQRRAEQLARIEQALLAKAVAQ